MGQPKPTAPVRRDYHDYFEIKVSTALPLISSRLIFKGNESGEGGFLTNPRSCTGVGPQTTTTLHLEYEGGETAKETYYITDRHRRLRLVPFEPGFTLNRDDGVPMQPDGITTEFSLPHDPTRGVSHYDSSQVKTATITLPEGMTLNPSAAAGLEACTPAARSAIGTKNGVTCPAGSKLGTVSLEVPGLPAGSLTGNVYLGGPVRSDHGRPITGPSIHRSTSLPNSNATASRCASKVKSCRTKQPAS